MNDFIKYFSILFKSLNNISLIEHQKEFYQGRKKNYSIIDSHIGNTFEIGFGSKKLDV